MRVQKIFLLKDSANGELNGRIAPWSQVHDRFATDDEEFTKKRPA